MSDKSREPWIKNGFAWDEDTISPKELRGELAVAVETLKNCNQWTQEAEITAIIEEVITKIKVEN